MRYVHEVGELGDDIDNFERMRGLTMAAEGLPEWDTDVVTTRKSWAVSTCGLEHCRGVKLEAFDGAAGVGDFRWGGSSG